MEGARKFWELQQKLYWRGTSSFKVYVWEGMICNFPITNNYSFRANHIYGTARPLLQSDMKQHENLAIKVPIIPLREDISLNNKEIKIYIDLFYTNGMPFLRTKICKITFLTVENLSWRIIYKIIQ